MVTNPNRTVTKKMDGKILVLFLISLLVIAVVGCAGAKPPLTLTVSQPTDGAIVTKSPLAVRGTVSDPKATVMVNDVEAAMAPKGIFGSNVTLTEGENTINIVATRDKESVTKTLTVTYSPVKKKS